MNAVWRLILIVKVAVKTVDHCTNPLKFLIHMRQIGSLVTLDFRRVVVCIPRSVCHCLCHFAQGDGWDYKQFFIKLRSMLRDLEQAE